MENDYRIPKEIRGHFDAEWQINLALGCKYLKEIQDKANDPEIFRISGDLDKQNLQKIKSYFNILFEDSLIFAIASSQLWARVTLKETSEFSFSTKFKACI